MDQKHEAVLKQVEINFKININYCLNRIEGRSAATVALMRSI